MLAPARHPSESWDRFNLGATTLTGPSFRWDDEKKWI